MSREPYKEDGVYPEIRMDDVLIASRFSRKMSIARREKSFRKWFEEGVKPFEGKKLILMVVANGIKHYPDVVDYINRHEEWKVACHGLKHIRFSSMSIDEIREDLKIAVDKIEDAFDQKVDMFFPPYGKRDKNTVKVCEELGLWSTSHVCASTTYLSALKDGKRPENISRMMSFHYWRDKQNKAAEEVLNWDYDQYKT